MLSSRPDAPAPGWLAADPGEGMPRWTRWDERAAAAAEEVAIEWWTVLILRPRGDERLYFVERRTAEMYARFLLEQAAQLVVLEQWRDTGRVAVELMGVA